MTDRDPSKTTPLLVAALGSLALLACDTSSAGEPEPGAGVGTATDGGAEMGSSSGAVGMGSSGPPAETTGEPSSSSTTDPGAKFDLGPGADVGQPVGEGCPAVDFLFVLDNSISMQQYQENLQAAFPTFIDDIAGSLADVQSYHVGLVTTDAYFLNAPGCRTLGGLVVQSEAGSCGPYAEGGNYMTEADPLPEAFTCAASLGTAGHPWEQPMGALEAALGQTPVSADDPTPTTAGCNDGFLRDDALLVVVVIADEPEGQPTHSPGTPQTWFQSVVDAKGGVAENVVVLTITNGDACATAPNDDGGMSEFASMFGDNGVRACIRDDFSASLGSSIDIITDACQGFVPPPG